MSDPARLTLAFVGEQEVHRNNARSLLDDFVDGWQKQHRKGEVHVVLPDADPSTDTISDLDDWASTSGYEVSYEKAPSVVPFLLEQSDVRLILVGDPNDDDTLYDVAEEAAKYRVHTRSLINGLEKVVFDDDDFDDDLSGDGFHEVDVESGEGWAEDDDLTDEAAKLLAAVPDVEDAPADDAPVDLDLLATLADDGTVEAQEEIKDIAAALDIDVAPFETWADAVAAIRSKTLDEKLPVIVPHTEEVPEPSMPEDPILLEDSETGVSAPTPSSTSAEDVPPTDGDLTEASDLTLTAPHTREQLEAMSFDQVKAIGLDYGIASGRGMKHGVYVNKILLASGVETVSPKRPRNRKKPALEVVAPVGAGLPPVEDAPLSSNVVPINELLAEGKSLKVIADTLRQLADELDPPEN
jgi:hypothetical protein